MRLRDVMIVRLSPDIVRRRDEVMPRDPSMSTLSTLTSVRSLECRRLVVLRQSYQAKARK